MKYIFFRIYNYFKKLGADEPLELSSLIVLLFEIPIIFIILTILRSYEVIGPTLGKYQYAIFIVPFWLINFLFIQRPFDYEESQQKWKNERKFPKLIKGSLIAGYLIVGILYLAYGVLKDK